MLVPVETRIRLPTSESYKLTSYLTPFSIYHRLLVNFLLLIGYRGTPVYYICLGGGNPKPTTTKFGEENPQTVSCRTVQTLLR